MTIPTLRGALAALAVVLLAACDKAFPSEPGEPVGHQRFAVSAADHPGRGAIPPSCRPAGVLRSSASRCLP